MGIAVSQSVSDGLVGLNDCLGNCPDVFFQQCSICKRELRRIANSLGFTLEKNISGVITNNPINAPLFLPAHHICALGNDCVAPLTNSGQYFAHISLK